MCCSGNVLFWQCFVVPSLVSEAKPWRGVPRSPGKRSVPLACARWVKKWASLWWSPVLATFWVVACWFWRTFALPCWCKFFLIYFRSMRSPFCYGILGSSSDRASQSKLSSFSWVQTHPVILGMNLRWNSHQFSSWSGINSLHSLHW